MSKGCLALGLVQGVVMVGPHGMGRWPEAVMVILWIAAALHNSATPVTMLGTDPMPLQLPMS